MNKFKKKTRSKVIAASIAILSSAAVVSTGFAAWVISGGDTNSEVSGTITADTVTDEIHKITITEQKNNKVYFGGPTTTQSDSAWLKNKSADKENLSPSITFTVAGLEKPVTDPSALFKSIELKENEGVDEKNKYETAVGKNVVAALPKRNPIGNSFDTSVGSDSKIYLTTTGTVSDDNTQTFTATMVFKWGSEFGNMNPYECYADTAFSADVASKAKTNLELVQAINTSFTLTIMTL